MADPTHQPRFAVDGNTLTLLDTGPRRLEALVALIDGATESLRVLFYIYVDDAAGSRVRDALLRACARGVAVSLIVDGLGSETAASRNFFRPLEAAGARVCVFVPRWGRRYLLRNHQKLALADGKRIIVGGFNVENSYFGTEADAAWRDLGVLLEGPAAGRLAGYFDALAEWTGDRRAKLRTLARLLSQWSEGEGRVRWLLGGPSRRLSPWAREVRREIRSARRIDLIAAYFAPGPAMLRRLDKAARRGTLRIVLPSRTDHGIALDAQRFTYRHLLRRPVQLFEYQPTKLHTKLFVGDDAVHIGSANFDVRSMFLNMELMLRVEDAAFARHLHAYVDGEIARSERITAELHRGRMTLWTRIKQGVAYFIMAAVDLQVSHRLNFWR